MQRRSVKRYTVSAYQICFLERVRTALHSRQAVAREIDFLVAARFCEVKVEKNLIFWDKISAGFL